MFIPDLNFFHPGSRKEFKYFNPEKLFLSSRKYDPGCSSRTPDPDPDCLPIPDPGVKKIPDPGVKKAPDPESGFATLPGSTGCKIIRVSGILKTKAGGGTIEEKGQCVQFKL
jgi:hypothetical protein